MTIALPTNSGGLITLPSPEQPIIAAATINNQPAPAALSPSAAASAAASAGASVSPIQSLIRLTGDPETKNLIILAAVGWVLWRFLLRGSHGNG